MAASMKPPVGSQAKRPMRQQSARPPSRAQFTAPSLNPRKQSGTVSPTESIASLPSMNTNMLSPSSGAAAGVKRKERDFEGEGEETNIHVVVRCRGRNEREVKENSGVVVSTDGVKGKKVELSMGANALSNKTYHFDRVFSPAADQSMIYEEVVTPMLDEMLQGYNCTIFAYGQTGTGKTYTMSGDMSDTLGLLSVSAGIIPRVLHSLFDKLEADEAESSVKCSFIELYNEELRDLLSVEEQAKLKIFEDSQKKGHCANIVHGMEESHIKSARAGIKLLQEGSHKRQVAATKCNDLSSRSHTVFTITVYIKRTAENGEDFVSAGKLNLVDLAGSENIQRSGAENKRAAEAGLINKSLLTLGRVINALVERGSHIPYRESKLTRLLQDSLGGRTKTCIIATVSPAKSNLEETISTLDYAFRAKNIRNKPQVNQMVSKRTLLREFTTEIEKLKSELIATRNRNGIYLSASNYEEITGESESRRILSEEQKAKIETMEANLRNKVQELFALTNNFNNLRKDNESTKQLLDQTTEVLDKTEIVLKNTRQNLAEEHTLRKAHQLTEERLNNTGGELISTLEKTVTDIGGLHSKIRRTSLLHANNRAEWESSQTKVADITELVEQNLDDFRKQQEQLFTALSTKIQGWVREELGHINRGQMFVNATESAYEKTRSEVIRQTLEEKEDMDEILKEIETLREEVKQKVGEGLTGLSTAAGRISAGVINELEDFHTQLHASYSSLGKDFKNMFEGLVKHLNAQRAEADELRKTASAAIKIAMEADDTVSSRLRSCLADEREQSALERRNLLSQITELVNKNGHAAEDRWHSKINAFCDELSTSSSNLQTVNISYNGSMDTWSQKEQSLVDEVSKSRDALKAKMKQDWTAINQHNTSIQTTTKAVHEETVRIVDAQMKDMASQMQALDDFVFRAQMQNKQHQETHLESLRELSDTVSGSYTSMANRFAYERSRVLDLEGVTRTETTALEASLLPLTGMIQIPLSALRQEITGAPLKEYIPTGETPQKTQYSFPTTLPRTEPHERILAKLLSRPSSSSSDPSFIIPPSPSKSVVYNDTHVSPPPPPLQTSSSSISITTPPILVEDLVVKDEIIKLSLPLSTSTTTGGGGGGGGGLREIPLNITANSAQRHSDPNPSTISSSSPISIANAKIANAMGPPPLKRHATATSGVDSKLPQKLGNNSSAAATRAATAAAAAAAAGMGEKMGGKVVGGGGGGMKGVIKLEGRENVLPGTGVGTGRRLRSSPLG